MKAQLKELLTNYGPVGVLWFDGQWEGTWTAARGRDLYDYVRGLQPSDHRQQSRRRADGIGDFGTPEQEIPATGMPGVDWETCMTMNRNWGFNRADKDFKSAADPRAESGGHRVQGRQLPAERRADGGGRVPGGERRAPRSRSAT